MSVGFMQPLGYRVQPLGYIWLTPYYDIIFNALLIISIVSKTNKTPSKAIFGKTRIQVFVLYLWALKVIKFHFFPKKKSSEKRIIYEFPNHFLLHFREISNINPNKNWQISIIAINGDGFIADYCFGAITTRQQPLITVIS